MSKITVESSPQYLCDISVRRKGREYARTLRNGTADEILAYLCTITRSVRDEVVIVSCEKKCLRCKGEGQVVDHEEPEASDDGMMPCPHCEGDGTEPKV